MSGVQWGLPVRRHIAIPRRPLGPVRWQGDRMPTDVLSGMLRRGQQSTSRHGHGCASYHAHGHMAVGAGLLDGGRVEGGGDAVGLHHCCVVDNVRLSCIHRLCVVRTLSIEVLLGIGTSDWVHGRLVGVRGWGVGRGRPIGLARGHLVGCPSSVSESCG